MLAWSCRGVGSKFLSQNAGWQCFKQRSTFSSLETVHKSAGQVLRGAYPLTWAASTPTFSVSNKAATTLSSCSSPSTVTTSSPFTFPSSRFMGAFSCASLLASSSNNNNHFGQQLNWQQQRRTMATRRSWSTKRERSQAKEEGPSSSNYEKTWQQFKSSFSSSKSSSKSSSSSSKSRSSSSSKPQQREQRDAFEVLEVPEDADDQQIKESYRRKARENHPDLHPNDPHATYRFQEITVAYSQIKDQEARSSYLFERKWSFMSNGMRAEDDDTEDEEDTEDLMGRSFGGRILSWDDMVEDGLKLLPRAIKNDWDALMVAVANKDPANGYYPFIRLIGPYCRYILVPLFLYNLAHFLFYLWLCIPLLRLGLWGLAFYSSREAAFQVLFRRVIRVCKRRFQSSGRYSP